MAGAPLPTDEKARLEALHQLDILDTPLEEAFDNLTRLTAGVMGVPISLVSLVDQNRQWFKSNFGLEARETPRHMSFCAYAVYQQDILIIENAKADERFADNPLVTGEPYIQFYAGVPLYSQDGFVLGTLCIIDREPRSLSTDQADQLRSLAQQVEQLLKLHLQTRKLKEQIVHTEAINARYQAASQGAAAGIVRINGLGHILGVNRHVCQMLGYSEDDLLGKNVSMLMPPHWGDHHDNYLAAYQRSGVAKVIGIGREVTALHRKGYGIPVHLAVSEIARQADRDDFEQRQFMGLLTDITDLHETREQLREAKNQAEQANRAKTDFLSSMSHELRTPLNAILGFSQLLQNSRNPLPERKQRQAEQITRSGRHLLSLINEVLDLTRIESGQMLLSLESVRLNDVIREAVEIVQPLADEQGIRLVSQLPGSGSGQVYGDYTRIKQVLINLLNNAVKYNTEDGSVTLTYKVSNQACRISVLDTGIGIPANRLGELFQPFSRLDAEHGSVEGTGVGLALTHKLVRLMDGNIGVNSQPGEGSVFWFELPLSDPALLSTKTPITRASARSQNSPNTTHNVLYIGDNPALVEDELQQNENLVVQCAPDVDVGMEIACSDEPCVIMISMDASNVNGFEAQQLLNRNLLTACIPVIALTSDASQQLAGRAQDLGFHAYLVIPFEPGTLSDRVRKILDQETR